MSNVDQDFFFSVKPTLVTSLVYVSRKKMIFSMLDDFCLHVSFLSYHVWTLGWDLPLNVHTGKHENHISFDPRREFQI